MRDNKTIVIQERCKNCYKDSPKAFKNEQSQSLAKCLSEYQSAFKTYTWQPVRQSLKPLQSNMAYGKARAMIERRSTYGVDYMFHVAPKKVLPKKHRAELKVANVPMNECSTYHKDYVPKELNPVPKATGKKGDDVVISNNTQKFKGDSIYTLSYPAFDDQTLAECKQSPIKKKDNMEVPGPGTTDGRTQSTAQSDFIHHENVERPAPMRPVENTERPTDPLQERTEYTDFYTTKTQDVHLCKKNVSIKPDCCQFMGTSTAMADFTIPAHIQQPKSCCPAASYHLSRDKFDGLSTFTTAYKPWPVKRYELPIWAKKPTYKRPTGGMIVNTLYMHDFRDPKVICPPTPIVTTKATGHLIKHDRGDTNFENTTTYNKEYKAWTDITAPESYRINEVYKAPAEKMMCETNHSSHFKGVQTQKMKPCRHESQHRSLNTDTVVNYNTTYTDNFTSPRPFSSPCRGTASATASMARCSSAVGTKPAVSEGAELTADKVPTSIPKPDLSVKPEADVLKITTDEISTVAMNCSGCQEHRRQYQC